MAEPYDPRILTDTIRDQGREIGVLTGENLILKQKLRYVRRHLDRFRDWAVQLKAGGMELVVDHLERSIDEVLPHETDVGTVCQNQHESSEVDDG